MQECPAKYGHISPLCEKQHDLCCYHCVLLNTDCENACLKAKNGNVCSVEHDISK